MNEGKVGREVIKQTRDSLGKIVKKPELTVKLLEKPPFRFIYDIVMAVIQQTGFMKKIFTGPDLKPDNFKTKESKIVFLNKLISVIELELDTKLDVNSNKIVAGKEVEKTNKMLQQLAQILLKRKQTRSKDIPCPEVPEVCPATKPADLMDKPIKGSNDTIRMQQFIKAIEKLGNSTGIVAEFRQITERFNEDVPNMEKEYQHWVQLNNELDSRLVYLENNNENATKHEIEENLTQQQKQIELYEGQIQQLEIQIGQNHENIRKFLQGQ